jgi:hypothetical protein
MESQKLSQEVLDQIKQLQEKNQAVVLELGQIELLKISLKEKKVTIEQFLTELRAEEKTLGEFLEKEYGSGTIDIAEGLFIPTEQE